ncbi:MAG: UvrB/UvrC motif-containing protein [Peptococcaceae bacterium]|jgi:protein arginine kinase activator|nr:UvrB/UvrC motif-containing protein [Peptococcaceae bacterium]
MLCERCQERPATVHITEIMNSQTRKIHLCEQCARDLQAQSFGFLPQFEIHNFLAGLLGMGPGTAKSEERTEQAACPDCGLREGQFAQNGLLGCGNCYSAFYEQMQPLVKRIHGHDRHTGKVPERTGGYARLIQQVERLKEELRQAVAREEFEAAAGLRDRIKELEKGIGQER